MTVTTVLWDNDGVLVDTERLYFRATQETLSSVGIALDDETFREHFLVRSSGVASLLPEATADEIARLRALRDVRYTELLAQERIEISGAAETLEALYGTVKMGVVTSSLRRHFEQIHARTGFSRYFEFVLASGDYEVSKPHPAPYLAGIRAAAARVEECLVIEDSLRGLTAAKAAGLRCWVIPSALTAASDLSAADRIISSIEEVPKLLRGLR